MPYKGGLFLSSISIFLFFFYVVLASLSPELPTAEQPIYLYSTSKTDLQRTLLEAISQAKESIHLVMFGLSDPAILSALARKINQGLDVHIYYDPKGSGRIDLLLKQAKTHPIFSSGLMHQKIMIIDRKMIFMGSANMTTASLRMHDNLIIGCIDQKAADFLIQNAPLHPGYIKTFLQEQEVEIWLLPDLTGNALENLCKKIRSAKRSIKIALFTYTHPLLIEELIAASKRGIQVAIVIDMHNSLGASAKGIQQMKKENISIFISQGAQLMHHKFLWIDENLLITGSANWTRSAFSKNNDCLIAIHDLNKKQKRFMRQLWKELFRK